MYRLCRLFLVLGVLGLLAACQTGLPGTGGASEGVTPNAVAGDPIEVTALDALPQEAATEAPANPAAEPDASLTAIAPFFIRGETGDASQKPVMSWVRVQLGTDLVDPVARLAHVRAQFHEATVKNVREAVKAFKRPVALALVHLLWIGLLLAALLAVQPPLTTARVTKSRCSTVLSRS